MQATAKPEILKYASKGESRMARKFIKEILDRGLKVSVNDGEEWVVKRSTNTNEILAALCSTGEDHISVRNEAGEQVGYFYLVWGNALNGEELVADHTDNEFCNEVWKKVFDC